MSPLSQGVSAAIFSLLRPRRKVICKDVGTGVWVGEWDSQMKGRADRKPKSIMGKITSSCAKWPLFGKGLEFSFVFGLVCGEFVPCKFSTRVPFVSWHLNRPSPFVLPPTLYVPPKKKEKWAEIWARVRALGAFDYGVRRAPVTALSGPISPAPISPTFSSTSSIRFLLRTRLLPLHAICMSWANVAIPADVHGARSMLKQS